MSALTWHAEPHPFGTGRPAHAAGAFWIESWITEGPRGGEALAFDLYDGEAFISSHRSAADAKTKAQRLHAVDADASTRAMLRRLLAGALG